MAGGATGDRQELDGLVRHYFAARSEFARLAVIAAAERAVDAGWNAELVARRRAAEGAYDAARESLRRTRSHVATDLENSVAKVRLHAAADRREEVLTVVADELYRLQLGRRRGMKQLVRQLHRVREAKDALLEIAGESRSQDVASLRDLVVRAILARHHPRLVSDQFVIEGPLVAVASSDDGVVLVHVEGESNAAIARSALVAAGAAVRRDDKFGQAGNCGVRLIVEVVPCSRELMAGFASDDAERREHRRGERGFRPPIRFR